MTRHQRRRSNVLFAEALEQRTLFAVGGTYTAPADPRATLDIDSGWKFNRNNVSGAQAATFNDSAWSTVNVPHTWNATDGEDGGGDYYRGVGWYRKTVAVPSSMLGDTIHVRFEGASVGTTLYVDGTLIGTHVGAFGAFDFDLTSKLASGGSHVLAVKVDNSASYDDTAGPQAADFTTFGGIYRDVSLLGVNAQHVTVDDFASPGVKFSTPTVSTTSASTKTIVGLSNDATTSRNLNIHSYIVDASGKIVAETNTARTMAAGEDATITQTSTITNPHLWNGTLDPYLHNLYVEVRDASTNALVDFIQQRVGVRSYQISATQGFLLNGKVYPLHGVTLHQDRIDQGWAISDANIREDMGFFTEMGANALRSAHYEQNNLMYDIADEKGIVVYTEIPNVGSGNQGVIPTSAAFAASMQQQLKELIRQRYNHPSIILWGVFNEVANNAANIAFVANMSALVHSEDPTRPSAGASYSYNLSNLERSVDVPGWNRYYGWYYGVPADFGYQLDMLHAQSPAFPVGVTEYGAGGDISQHAENPSEPQHDGPFHPEEYESIYHEQNYKVLQARPYLWGTFIWDMFDFASDDRAEGDTAGRNDKGLVTYDRKTRKDAFYFYKANWSSDAVVHINSSRWTDRTVAATQIKFYSNITNPVLKLNGVVVGSVTSQGNDVYTSPTINLQPGANIVTLTGIRNGTTYTDTVTWTMAGATTPTAPAAASALTASASSATTVALVWNDNSTNETGFRVERRLGTGGTWSVLTTTAANVKTYIDGTAAPSTTYNYQVFAINAVGASAASNAASVTTPVADAYTSADIGSPALAGSTSVITPGKDYDITAGGSDIWGTADQFRFVYKTISGDFDYSARIADVSVGNSGSMAGLMARESLTASSQHIYSRAIATNEERANYRLTTGGTSVGVGGAPIVAFPNAYVRLQRVGNVFNAFGSPDGVTWTLITQQTLVMPATIYFGIAVSARTSTATTTAKVRDLTDRSTLLTPPAAPTNLVATPNVATPSIGLTWQDNSTNETGYRVERKAAGATAWSTLVTLGVGATSYTDAAIAFDTAYTYRVFATSAAGDSLPTAEVSQTASKPVAPAAPLAPTNLVPSNNAGVAKLTWSDNSPNELYFQVERQAANGVWSSIAIVAANTTSFTDTTVAAGATYSYRVRALGAVADSAYSNEAALIAASSLSYASVDIGGISGGATETVSDGNAYNVTASGSDVWDKSDQFRFVYRQLTGDFDIRVRVNSVSMADVQSMAGLMARASLDADSRNLFLKVRADGKDRMTYRSSTGGTSTGIGGGTSAFPGVWLRLKRSGNTFTGYASADGVRWTVVSNATLSLPKTLYVGMAASSHVAGSATTTAEFRDLTLA